MAMLSLTSSLTLGGPANAAAMLQEVYALAAYSDHPHIVTYHSAWMEEQDLYIQLELCSRGSLGERLLAKEAFTEGKLRMVLPNPLSSFFV
jgi:serine/threonine protein kinase